MAETTYDILIIGQGAAAFGAGLYAARYQAKPIVIGEKFGGETATGGVIENYPGYVSIEGLDLMLAMKAQVEKYQAPLVDAKVTRVARQGECFVAETDEASYQGQSLILAVGRERRTLGLAHEREWTGRGVSYCAVCDAPLYRGKVAGVVGGGDSAVKGAVLLSKYAKRVYLIHRGDRLTRPEPVNVQHLRERPNVEPLFRASVVALEGDGGLSGVTLDRPHNGSARLALDGLFIEIGADPNVDLARQLGVALTPQDEIEVDKLMRTNVEGVFAAGDVTNGAGHLKQTITAAAQGVIAATSAYNYVAKHPHACQKHAVGASLA